MKLNLICFLLFFMIIGRAQSPYYLDWKKEPVYFGLGLGSLAAGSIVESNFVSSFSVEEILRLDRSEVNTFDQNATFNYSHGARNGSDITLFSSYALPTLLLINKKTRKDFGQIAILYAESFSLTLGLTNLTKRLVKRTRPFVYNDLASFSDKQTKNAKYSFFSGHTSMTAVNSFFAAKVFTDYFPESRWKPLVWTVAFFVPATTGYFRVKAGKHYPTDIIAGIAVGGLVGILVPHLHKVKKTKKGNRITFVASPSSVRLSLVLN